ncbi:MAG: 2-amino-4-hydroxy-6-hydroxymethyldihydropteridine diphosphokinase, partial [Thermoguttaceae bacterium]
MPQCLIGLGSNLGDRAALLDAAISLLRDERGVELAATSRYHETAAAGGPAGQARFLNAAVLVLTHLLPGELLDAAMRIESRLGRRREERWGPRSIDIDLLLYDGLTVRGEGLRLPHPRMAWRRFVLAP